MSFLAIRAARSFAALSTAAIAATLLSVLPQTAQAQTHIGNGQALQVNADLVSAVNIAAGSARAQLPSPAGGSDSVGPSVFAQNITLVDAGILGGDTVLGVDASALSAATTGGSGQVFSSAQVASVGNNTPDTNLTLGLQTPLVSLGVAPGLSNFLSLKAIRTDTTAIGAARSSTTIIEGLAIRTALGSFLTLDNSVLGLAGNGTTTLDGTVNLSFSEASDTVSFNVPGALNLGTLASIRLHDKVNNADGSRTTNGITVAIGDGFLVSDIASVTVNIASSTAGVSGAAAAPEPGTVGLVLTPFVAGLAVQVRRRRKAGIIHQN